MDFDLTEEQVLTQDMIRNFVETEMRPIADEIDRKSRKQRGGRSQKV
jgi:butyryl-CoA dehydrogenase